MSRKRIKRLKDKLASGQLSQQEAEATAQQIRDLGGKVAIKNFGYAGVADRPTSPSTPTSSPAPSTPAPQAPITPVPSTSDVASMATAARPIKDPGSVYGADVAGEQAESATQITLQNPNFFNPFGSQTTTLNPDGSVSVDQSLSQDQQQILQQGSGLTQQGQQAALQRLGGMAQPFGFDRGGFEAERARIEDAVFSRLTRGMEDDYRQAREAKEQQLYNQGIPYSADPNSRYQRELNDIDKRFDNARLQARSQATAQGLAEQQGAYGMDLGTYQQGISDLYSFSGLGTGLQLPQFQQYQGPNYDVADPSSYIYAGKELQQGNKNFRLQKDAMRQDAAIANKQLALASQASQPQPPQPPAFP